MDVNGAPPPTTSCPNTSYHGPHAVPARWCAKPWSHCRMACVNKKTTAPCTNISNRCFRTLYLGNFFDIRADVQHLCLRLADVMWFISLHTAQRDQQQKGRVMDQRKNVHCSMKLQDDQRQFRTDGCTGVTRQAGLESQTLNVFDDVLIWAVSTISNPTQSCFPCLSIPAYEVTQHLYAKRCPLNHCFITR